MQHMRKLCLSTILLGFQAQASADGSVSMKSVETLFNQVSVELSYPLVLVFDSDGTYMRQHAGTLENPLTPSVLKADRAADPEFSHTDLPSSWPIRPLESKGALVLLTIDERMCPACATEQDAFSQLQQKLGDDYSFTSLRVEFR